MVETPRLQVVVKWIIKSVRHSALGGGRTTIYVSVSGVVFSGDRAIARLPTDTILAKHGEYIGGRCRFPVSRHAV